MLGRIANRKGSSLSGRDAAVDKPLPALPAPPPAGDAADGFRWLEPFARWEPWLIGVGAALVAALLFAALPGVLAERSYTDVAQAVRCVSSTQLGLARLPHP